MRRATFAGGAGLCGWALVVSLSACSCGGGLRPVVEEGEGGAGGVRRGACTITGSNGPDRLIGTSADDVICGRAGNDVLIASGGTDVLRGGEGADTLRARNRHPRDALYGGDGVDLCIADPEDSRRGCGHPLVAGHLHAVPILMYHVIGDPPPGTPLTHLWVSPHTFARHMAYLDRHGYHAVGLREVFDWWHGAPLPAKPIVVSFDDGFSSQYTRAKPVLDRHGWAGTLNLAVSHVGQAGGLTRRRISRLLADDWELDSHTMTHASLPGLGADALRREVRRSRTFLQRRFHVPVGFLCYPGGAYDARVIAAVRAAGYLGATTTEEGFARWSEPYSLDRVRVSRGDGVAALAAKLAAG